MPAREFGISEIGQGLATKTQKNKRSQNPATKKNSSSFASFDSPHLSEVAFARSGVFAGKIDPTVLIETLQYSKLHAGWCFRLLKFATALLKKSFEMK
jgi:hypothetical protein